MYKLFALFILILAPIVVTLADNFAPRDPQQQFSPSSDVPGETPPVIEASAPASEASNMPPPAFEAPPADSPILAGAPMIDAKGAEPTPQLQLEGATPPAQDVTSEGAGEGSSDEPS